MTNSSSADTLQGYRWAKRVSSKSTVSTSKNYSLGASYQGASVGLQAGETVTTVRKHSEVQGNIGPDYHLGSLYKLNSAWDPNRVDVDWIATDNQGNVSGDMVGNVGVAYYWYPMNSGHHNFYSVAAITVCLTNTGILGPPPCIEAGKTVKS